MRQGAVAAEGGDAGNAYLSKADLRREFGLTESHVARLGPADRDEPDPGSEPAELHGVYSRERVEQWVAENRDLLADSEARREAREVRRARDKQVAETRQ